MNNREHFMCPNFTIINENNFVRNLITENSINQTYTDIIFKKCAGLNCSHLDDIKDIDFEFYYVNTVIDPRTID